MRVSDITMTLAAAVFAFAALGCDTVEDGETIGTRGGTVYSDDGRFSIEIPDGALEQDVVVTVEEVECDRPDALSKCYEVGPVGLPLLFPAEVTYEVDADMLGHFRPDEIAVMVEKQDHWDYLADRRVDPDVQIVSASAVYLSRYVLVSMPTIPPPGHGRPIPHPD